MHLYHLVKRTEVTTKAFICPTPMGMKLFYKWTILNACFEWISNGNECDRKFDWRNCETKRGLRKCSRWDDLRDPDVRDVPLGCSAPTRQQTMRACRCSIVLLKRSHLCRWSEGQAVQLYWMQVAIGSQSEVGCGSSFRSTCGGCTCSASAWRAEFDISGSAD